MTDPPRSNTRLLALAGRSGGGADAVGRWARAPAATRCWAGAPAGLAVLVLCAPLLAREAKRPANWAQPLKRPGLPNLHRVDPRLYRGAQPTAQGMRELKKLGVKTVVNLRALHSDRDEIGSTTLAYIHMHLTALRVTDKNIVAFLNIVTDATRAPVFVHCQHGADRTGVLCAAYRIAVQGWTKDAAIREMTQGGFGHHAVFGSLTEYLRKADFQAIRAKAGLSEPRTTPPPAPRP